MRRHWRAFVRGLRKLTLKDILAATSLVKTVIDIVRALRGHG